MQGFSLKFKQFIEQTKEKFHVGEPAFRPTPNVRNPTMLQEATDFAQAMVTFRDAVTKYAAEINNFLHAYPSLMQHNLPRMWVSLPEHPGQCEPVRPKLSERHPTLIGGDFNEAMLQESRIILRSRLDGIIKPIQQWLDSLEVVKIRMKKLEALQLLVDAKRRSMGTKYDDSLYRIHRYHGQNKGSSGSSVLEYERRRPATAAAASALKYSNQRPTTSASSGRDKQRGLDIQDFEEEPGQQATAGVEHSASPFVATAAPSSIMEGGLEQSIHLDRGLFLQDESQKAMHNSRKLQALTGSFEDQEELVFEHLRGLVLQAPWLKSHLAASFIAVKETVQASLVALGPCMQPLPNCTKERCLVTDFGELGVCDHLAAEIPDKVLKHKGEAESVFPPAALAQTEDAATPQYEPGPAGAWAAEKEATGTLFSDVKVSERRCQETYCTGHLPRTGGLTVMLGEQRHIGQQEEVQLMTK
ncbi:hypothetical protein CEUSTIGMA_g10210.t1 [Chlamydomonas eustigma]|uniref:BAR domain-containing protein n=1 Tax=Chlamydomonas eustigma TaxID=1157962 RepID=A0A250XI77_9CHLO|nr:hypothetical protein CEUSTIGMA_g10210.t1 [Chlamydomonas eustigma]|eukprot:GAX82784.1 hypothetical protein CEUSTIGMA_g10210.t1 [Chlamydomonas eustigma]